MPTSLPDHTAEDDRRGTPHRSQGILANVSYSLVSQVASGIFTAILTLYLVRALRPAAYGQFSLAVGVATLALLPADFGVASSAARFVAQHLSDRRRVASILADALRVKIVLSGIACVVLIALAAPIASAYHAPLAWPLRIIAFAVFGQSVMFLFQYAFTAARLSSKNVTIAFGESAVECGASVALVILGGGVVGAVAGRAIGYVCGALLALRMGAATFSWPRFFRPRGRRTMRREIVGFAWPLMLVGAASSVFAMIDILLIGGYLGSRQAGLFNAPARLVMVIAYLGVAAASGIAPRMLRGDRSQPDGGPLVRGLRWTMLVHSLLLAPLIIWTAPIVRIALGPHYLGSVPTLRWLALAVYLDGVAPLVSISVNYLGDVRSRVPIMVGATLLNALVDVILIPRIGIVAGAIGTAAAFVVMVAGHLVICARHVQLPWRAITITALRGLLAAGAMGGVLALIGSDPGAVMLIIGALVGTLTFLVVLVALGEVKLSELTAGVAWIRRRTGTDRAPA